MIEFDDQYISINLQKVDRKLLKEPKLKITLKHYNRQGYHKMLTLTRLNQLKRQYHCIIPSLKPLKNYSSKKPQQQSNHYQTLDISPDSSFDDIKKQFKQLSKIYHPDYYKGKDNKFHEIQNAYKILSQFKTRKHHDINLGITHSLWESEQFKLENDKFDNETFEEFLNSDNQHFHEIKSLEQKLYQKFQKQINQEMTKTTIAKSLFWPSFAFIVFWGAWNIFEYIILNYKGEQFHDFKSYQGDKKLSAVPINIR